MLSLCISLRIGLGGSDNAVMKMMSVEYVGIRTAEDM
jgi:hypothetical protein